MSISIPSEETRLQLISSSNGLNILCTCTEGAGLGLAFTILGGLLPQLDQVIAADRVRQLYFGKSLAQRVALYQHLEVHFGFPAQLGYALAESPAIGPDGLAESVVRVENGPEAEGQYGARPETDAYNPGVLEDVFFLEFCVAPVVFADDDCKVTTGVAEDRGSIYALNAF